MPALNTKYIRGIIRYPWIVTALALVSIGIHQLYVARAKPSTSNATLISSTNTADNQVSRSAKISDATDQTLLAGTPVQTTVTSTKQNILDSATIQTIVSQYPGSYSIAVAKIGVADSYVGYNDTAPWVTASLYKLLQTYSLFKSIESGELSWDTPVLENDSISSCFDKMIRYSDNDCGIAVQDLLGNDRIDTDLHTLGLTSTDLNNLDGDGSVLRDKITTARDMITYLQVILDTTTLTTEQVTPLIAVMSEQEYRFGIPTGVAPLLVADKVGFLDQYLNDAGVVFGERGVYVVVILSADSDWESVANISKALIDIFEAN